MFRRGFLALGLVVVVGACASNKPVTEGVDGGPAAPEFSGKMPVDALRAIAEEIETQVAAGNREPTLTSVENLVVDTPAVRQAVRTRAARIDLVNTFLNSGNAWERRNGRLWVIRTKAYKESTTSRQRDIDAVMVNSENRDRWAIYEGLMEANKLGGSLSDVEFIFFEARLRHMVAGQKFEADNGEQTAIASTN